MNHPPSAGGGIAGNLSNSCRLGLKDPPAEAGGIRLNVIVQIPVGQARGVLKEQDGIPSVRVESFYN